MKLPNSIEAGVILSVGDMGVICAALEGWEPTEGLINMRREHRDDLVREFKALIYGLSPKEPTDGV